MSFNFSQLIAAPGVDQWRSDITAALSGSGYATDTWKAGTPPRDMLEMCAFIAADISSRIASVAQNCVLATAEGDFLKLKADSEFDTAKVVGTPAVGIMRFYATAGEGPYSVGVGGLTVGVGDLTVAADDLTFTNVSPFTIPLGTGASYQTGSMQCNAAGTDGNIPSNSSLQLQTQNVSVTVTNPVRDDTTALLSPGWLSTLGTDEETDASLYARARLKLAGLATGENTSDRVKLMIVSAADLTGSIAPEGIIVDDQAPRGLGTFDVYLSQRLVTATSLQVTSSLNAISGSFMSGSHGRILVQPAPTQNMNVTMTVVYDNVEEAEVSDGVDAAIDDYIAAMPLGGNRYNSSVFASNYFFLNDLVRAIADVDGVKTVQVSSFCGNTPASDGTPTTARTKLVEGASTIYYFKVAS